ncbi:hypothetical protein B0A49_13919, partial [Cryomyces minteri]
LKEALMDERKRRKRGKALSLEEAEEYHGGAVFWSPKKVKEARDRQRLRDLEEEQLQHQKVEATRLREEQKQAKAEAVQARRLARAEARLLKEKQKADQAADRALWQAARRTAKRLQQTLELSQK